MKMVVALALAAAFTTAAQAKTAAVHYTDLDLATSTGKAELERRIEVAARRVCSAETQTGSRIIDRDSIDRCEADVRKQIAAKIAL